MSLYIAILFPHSTVPFVVLVPAAAQREALISLEGKLEKITIEDTKIRKRPTMKFNRPQRDKRCSLGSFSVYSYVL